MSFIFISHASEDKTDRIRPIAEVLIEEGEPLWLDRPGAGENNFGFDQSYISLNRIDHLQSGQPWSENLSDAIRNSGAVLGCISSALEGNREVILSELTVANAMGKLVTCIVDDLDYNQLGQFDFGFSDLSKAQSPRINPALLQEALKTRRQTGVSVEELPEQQRAEWEKVRNLIASINRVRKTPRPLREPDIKRIAPIIATIGHGPIIKITDVPDKILRAFGDHLGLPDLAGSAIQQTNDLITASTPDEELCRKLQIRQATLPNLGNSPSDNFWTQAFTRAGLQSKRTVASLIANPTANWALQQSSATSIGEDFFESLRKTNIRS